MNKGNALTKTRASYKTLQYLASEYHTELDLADTVGAHEDGAVQCLLSDYIPRVLGQTRSLAHHSGVHIVVLHRINVLSKVYAMALRKLLDQNNIRYILTIAGTEKCPEPSLSAIDDAIRSRALHVRCRVNQLEKTGTRIDRAIQNSLAELMSEKNMTKAWPMIRDVSYVVEKFSIPWTSVVNALLKTCTETTELISMAARLDHMSRLSHNPCLCLQRLLVYAHEKYHSKKASRAKKNKT
jgi:hypothetical protein